jgi:hypothetical protein
MDELFQLPLPPTTVVMILLLALPFVLAGMIQLLKLYANYLKRKEDKLAEQQTIT